jgi:hypothetical protein
MSGHLRLLLRARMYCRVRSKSCTTCTVLESGVQCLGAKELELVMSHICTSVDFGFQILCGRNQAMIRDDDFLAATRSRSHFQAMTLSNMMLP